jgi:hypothetical protein
MGWTLGALGLAVGDWSGTTLSSFLPRGRSVSHSSPDSTSISAENDTSSVGQYCQHHHKHTPRVRTYLYDDARGASCPPANITCPRQEGGTVRRGSHALLRAYPGTHENYACRMLGGIITGISQGPLTKPLLATSSHAPMNSIVPNAATQNHTTASFPPSSQPIGNEPAHLPTA